MPLETTYSSLRENLSSYLDQVTDDRDVVIVRRRGSRDVALIAADELAGLIETAHLLGSPKNAERLRQSIKQMERGEGKVINLEELRRSLRRD
jgi:antitoxin YefM